MANPPQLTVGEDTQALAGTNDQTIAKIDIATQRIRILAVHVSLDKANSFCTYGVWLQNPAGERFITMMGGKIKSTTTNEEARLEIPQEWFSKWDLIIRVVTNVDATKIRYIVEWEYVEEYE